ncbi:MAG: glycosyltransferase family 9 protein [Desulfobacterales bacterium]|jgi:ADP-heptose:LPS heptosyltransferase
MAAKSILIFHQGALGDFVLAFPALIRFKKYFKKIDAICQPQLGELAKELGLIDNWFSQDAACFASLFSDSIHPDTRHLLNSYHEIVLFSFSEHLEYAINQIRRHPVFRIPPRPATSDKIHVAVHILENLFKCGLIEKKDYLNSPELLSSMGINTVYYQTPRSRIILLHPGAGSWKKMWPLSNHLELEQLLKADSYLPEYLIGPAEEILKPQLLRKGDAQTVLHCTDDLAELISLMKSAGGFIGNDSGVSHLAAFLGLPTVAVFGPSDPKVWRPIGSCVRVLSSNELESHPNAASDSRPQNVSDAFKHITPAGVLQALHSVMTQA